jgi:uncharacterized membrane protein YgdD (TMEM256/DUF423 family)
MADDRRTWIRLAAVSGFVSVAAGAFAAHGVTDPAAKDLLRTGAQYQAIHALAVLAWAALVRGRGQRARCCSAARSTPWPWARQDWRAWRPLSAV